METLRIIQEVAKALSKIPLVHLVESRKKKKNFRLWNTPAAVVAKMFFRQVKGRIH